MADSGAVKEAEAGLANLILDEVTGEKVSKTELKRRQKAREKEAKKKEKEAAAPPKPVKKLSAEEEESNLTPNVSFLTFLRYPVFRFVLFLLLSQYSFTTVQWANLGNCLSFSLAIF